MQNLTRKPFSIWASTMLTQIGRTFFFLWENLIIFYIPLLFFLELAVVTMHCGSCPLLDQWLYQRKCCVQLVPWSRGKQSWQRSSKKPWDKFSFTNLSYFTTLSTKFSSALITHCIHMECGHCVKWILTIHLPLWATAGWPLRFQILPFSGSFNTCSLTLSLKGNLLPTTVWPAFLINNAYCVMRTIKAKVKNVKRFKGMFW